ncbi:ribosomal protein L18e/L15P [Lasiosphaeria hispida]|uniref:Ribosomal protein L18e/L15P n=1 Tax=Lasiosphaeria hispida TaxID=260671 RepID=A0AAJ0H5F2_9PEZI|nr:ribosomal protein L18e/L15P [Lasiosphaeria hispida]
MPPRLPLAQAARCCRASIAPLARPTATLNSFVSLFAALSVQTRSASILASLSDNRGAYSKRVRKGRGPSSGYGKTSGRGTKGQRAHGKVNAWFQGGQTPLIFSHGRKGFENHMAVKMSVINLDKLQMWIDNGRLDPTQKITPKELIKSGIIGRSIKDGIKLLARGGDELKTPIDIMVSRASETAIKAVEGAGGKITTRYYTKDALRRLVKGESISTDKPLPVGPEYVEAILEQARTSKKHYHRLPDPTSRWEIEYYRDPAHRGYLSHLLKPGESPSLYFKVPGVKAAFSKAKAKGNAENELDPKLF